MLYCMLLHLKMLQWVLALELELVYGIGQCPHTLWDMPIPHSNGLDFSLLFAIVLGSDFPIPYEMNSAFTL